MQIEQLEAFAQQDPDNPQIALMLGEAYLACGRLERAQGLLSQPACAALPRAQALLARLALMQGDYPQARDRLTTLCERETDNAALWHDLGFAELCLGDLGAAQAAVERARALATLPELHALAARIAHAEEDMARASHEIAQALALAPESAEVLGQHALIDLDCARFEAAAQHARAAIERDPQQQEALIVLSALAVQAQDPAAALAWAGQGLARQPNSARLRANRAQALLLAGDLAQARAEAEHAVALQPQHLGGWHVLAWSQLLQGDVESARASFEQAFERDRNFAETLGGLALVHALQGRPDETDRWLKRARRLDATSPTTVYAGVVRDSLGGDGKAHARLQSLLERLPAYAGVESEALLAATLRGLRGGA